MNAYVQFLSGEDVKLMDINITENSEFIVANRFGGSVFYNDSKPIIVVDSEETAWNIAMSKREEFDQEKLIMKTEHINNLVSLVTMTVDELHRGEHPDPIKAMEQHLRNNSDLYGDVLKEVVDHAINCVCTIKSRSKMYVVYLYGQHVWNNYSIQCIIESLDDLVKVRKALKEKCDIEFSERPYRDYPGFKKYINVTDERDVNLVVESTTVIK